MPKRKACLISDADLHGAALWRLKDWQPAELQAIYATLGDLISKCPSLDATHPAVASMLAQLHRPGDRRAPWTALCALATLWAADHHDQVLYHRAGFEVLAAYRQAQRGHHIRTMDALDELLTSYLRRHPATSARALFEHCQSLARVRMVVEDADGASLTYRTDPAGSRLKTLNWRAFEVRVSRIRKSATAAPADKPGAATHAFRWPSLAQPVVVSCAG